MLTSTFISINRNEEFIKNYKHKLVYMITLAFNIFRHLLDDTLKDVLSEQFRNRRSRLCQVNIKVNLIVWLVEFFGCMTMILVTSWFLVHCYIQVQNTHELAFIRKVMSWRAGRCYKSRILCSV